MRDHIKGPTLYFTDIYLSLDIKNVLFLQTLSLLLSTLCIPCHFLLGWIIMNPGLIPHDDAIKGVLSFAVIMFQVYEQMSTQEHLHSSASYPGTWTQTLSYNIENNDPWQTFNFCAISGIVTLFWWIMLALASASF